MSSFPPIFRGELSTVQHYRNGAVPASHEVWGTPAGQESLAVVDTGEPAWPRRQRLGDRGDRRRAAAVHSGQTDRLRDSCKEASSRPKSTAPIQVLAVLAGDTQPRERRRGLRGRKSPGATLRGCVLHVRRARTHRRPARTPGDITSAPPATPLGARPASVTHRCSDARSATRRNSPTSTSRRAAGPPEPASSRRSRANGCLPGELRTAPSRQPQEFRKRLKC